MGRERIQTGARGVEDFRADLVKRGYSVVVM